MSKKDEVEEVEEIEVEEATEQGGRRKYVRGPVIPRVSVTLPAEIRRKIRLAAALADMEENEWCRVVVVTAAERTVSKALGDKI